MARIYMGNLSHSAAASDVRHAFVVYGKVLNVDIVRDDETGDPRFCPGGNGRRHGGGHRRPTAKPLPIPRPVNRGPQGVIQHRLTEAGTRLVDGFRLAAAVM